ncbi:PREDICTED: membrane-associated phosphatidylinositol transfer protein 2-like [Amphimedon queenslandica]|uniref:DDHD domain-containing protein n=1 Tax=Amphimedon queenslandica TaxID=400682 RepID=A0AAN0JB33_AMPQE|nr:PREDICTED: membrane-associated phosphatidylinositol transfer protein 2-like [Amphimedon queenslandica]|eukprot:XP_019853987.1 PREDICTED: membrane-associated phosphatidylinositol transfer protein 2-like [Amphimedon queenslandica]
MMKETFEDVYSKHYQNSLSKVVLKFVLCPKITSGVCDLLQSILPPSSPQGNPNFPLTALPLLLLEDQSYHASVNSLIEKLNSVYCQFKQSDEGVNFSGDVCIVSDSVSSLMVYDILTRPSTPLLSNRANLSSSSNHLDGGSSDEGHSPFSSLRSVSVPSGSKSVPSSRKGGGALELPGLRGHPSSLLSSLLFNVSKVFTFGSPLGLVLSLKKLRGVPLSKPKCSSLYNLFYAVDPLGFRLEPLLDESFSSIDPLLIPCYLIYPTGDKSSVALSNFVSYVTTDERKGRGSGPSTSNECLFVLDEELKKSDTSRNDHRFWWGSDRIDYVLQAPNSLEGVVSLPNTSYGHIVQSRYLEAKELASFVLRQVLICKGHGAVSAAAAASSSSGFFVPFTPFTSTVKWAKKKTPLRIQKMSPNHRAVDVVIASHSTQLPHLQAKFFYGPLNMATLSGEMVNIFILSPSPQEKESISVEDNEGEARDGKKERAWCYLDSASTDKHGRISYPLSPEQVPSAPGVYPLIYLVKYVWGREGGWTAQIIRIVLESSLKVFVPKNSSEITPNFDYIF